MVNVILTSLQAKKVTRRSPAMRPWSKVNVNVKFAIFNAVINLCNSLNAVLVLHFFIESSKGQVFCFYRTIRQSDQPIES
jgi:hypothetical protein